MRTMIDFWKNIVRNVDGEGAGGSDPGAGAGGASSSPAPTPSIGDGSQPAATPAPVATPSPTESRERAETDRLAFLDAAFDRGMKKHREERGEPEPDGDGDGDQSPESDSHPTDPNRRKDGTFRAKQDPAQKAGVDPATGDEPVAVDPAATKTQQPQAPVVPVPAAWSRDMHEEFAKLTPAAQRYVAMREEQVSEGFKRMGPVARFGGEMAEVVDTHRDYFEARPNLRASQVMNNYLNFDRLVASNPAAAIIQLAQITQTDLGQLVEAIAQNQLNPREALLEHQLEVERTTATARQRRAEVERELAEEEAKTDEELRSQANFNQVKDGHRMTIERVSAKLPDFEMLEGDILALLPQVMDETPGKSVEEYLKEAHGRARRANPRTFAKMQAEAKAAAARRRADAVKRADNARGANRVNVTSVGGAPAATLRQAQDAAWERGMARAARR